MISVISFLVKDCSDYQQYTNMIPLSATVNSTSAIISGITGVAVDIYLHRAIPIRIARTLHNYEGRQGGHKVILERHIQRTYFQKNFFFAVGDKRTLQQLLDGKVRPEVLGKAWDCDDIWVELQFLHVGCLLILDFTGASFAADLEC